MITKCHDYHKCKNAKTCIRTKEISDNGSAHFYAQALKNNDMCTMYIDDHVRKIRKERKVK